jgi:hypothetical protein
MAFILKFAWETLNSIHSQICLRDLINQKLWQNNLTYIIITIPRDLKEKRSPPRETKINGFTTQSINSTTIWLCARGSCLGCMNIHNVIEQIYPELLLLQAGLINKQVNRRSSRNSCSRTRSGPTYP